MSVRGNFGTVGTGCADVDLETVADFGFHTADFGCTDFLADAGCRDPAGVDYNELGLDEMSGPGTAVLEYIPTS